MSDGDVRNLIIVGSGPAGLTAGIYAARANLKPLCVEGFMAGGLVPGGQLMFTTEVENYPGFPEKVTGQELMRRFRDQAAHQGCELITADVEKLELGSSPFRVWVEGEQTPRLTRTVIMATGARANYLGLESEQKLINKGVSACAVCDGALFRNQPVAVIGGGDTAMEEASYLAGLCSSVALIHRRGDFRASKAMQDRVFANPKIRVFTHTVVDEVLGADVDHVTGVRLRNLHDEKAFTLEIGAMFVAIGHTPLNDLVRGQLDLHPNGYVKTVPGTARTSVEGVFACGDVQDYVYRQAVTAAGTGCMAALEAERYLQTLGHALTLSSHRHGGASALSDVHDATGALRDELRELTSAARVLLEHYRDSGMLGAPREGFLPVAAARPGQPDLDDPWASTDSSLPASSSPSALAPSTLHRVPLPEAQHAPSPPATETRAAQAPSTRNDDAHRPTLYAAAVNAGAVRPNAALLGIEVPTSRAERHVRLAALADEVASCTRCRLHETRTRTVFARGNPDAEVCFVGEGPGADEDAQGLPFVGRAGQLLDKMIGAMGLGQDEVYVCNTVKCRPPENRKPEPDEMAACRPFFTEQLALVEPKVMVGLGGTAVEGLLGSRVAITRTRGQWKLYRTAIPLMPTYHPAYLLRTPEAKREAWADLRAVLERLGRPLPKRDG